MITVVVGMGISGKAADALLKKKGKRTLCVDREPPCIDWEEVEQVVVSPGVPLTNEVVKEAERRGVEVIGEVELGFRYLKNRAVGVTGTNGKTTTVRLIEHIFVNAGRKAVTVGNIGNSLCSYAMDPKEEEWLIVELSSFQLETMKSQCLDAAIFLNLTPDHFERYGTMEQYGKAKARIEQCLKERAKFWVSNQIKVGLKNPIYFEGQNGQAARFVCRDLGIAEEEIERAIKTFQKPAHRIEWVGEWEGVQFYNDSKATNVESVRYAVERCSSPIILLAGGLDKGAPYSPWIQQFQGKVKKVIAFGQAAKKIKTELENAISVQCVEGLKEAICAAVQNAKKGDTVLLSPGGSSYDQFQNYEHRGNEFKRMFEERVWIEKKSF